jgi:hypothetical protein
MKRSLTAVTCATLLLGLLPGVVAADRVTKYQDHHVGFVCETEIDGGFAAAHVDTSTTFGDFAGADIWFDPAIPFEDPSSLTGGTETVVVSEGLSQVDLSATFPIVDANGVGQGDATLVGTMTPVGDPEIIGPTGKTNHHSATAGTSQSYEGTATLTLSDRVLELSGCFGDVTSISVFEANPRSFVSSNHGVSMSCFWDTGDVVAAFSATNDGFGFFADAFLSKAELELFGSGTSGTMSVTSMTADVDLTDFLGGDTFTAAAEATLAPLGAPVTSTLIGATSRTKLTQQMLASSGHIDFSTGDSFDIGQENCQASEFSRHVVLTAPSGPKAGGSAPANDTPSGAIDLASGDRINVQTRAASFDAEVPITTCPEGPFDSMGRTLWYTIEGTGDPITIDTAGSDFDTLIGVFTPDGDGFTEVACIDDVFFDPIGTTYQAALTIDTVEGVTYYVQVGGFVDFFGGEPQFGRLRIKIS